jgi:peptidylprolyl isomerase
MPKLVLNIVAILLTACLAAAPLAGCGSNSSSSGSSEARSHPFRIPLPGGEAKIRYENEMKVGPSDLAEPEPKPVFPKGSPPEFLYFVDLLEGVGVIPSKGEAVTVRYVGYDYETHKKFASSWDEGKTFTFTPGKGEVIQGWEGSLLRLEGGDRRELVIPPSETEGPFPKGIPKGHAVIFVVERLPTLPASERQGRDRGPNSFR